MSRKNESGVGELLVMDKEQTQKKSCDENILKMLDEAHEEWESQQDE